MSQFDTTELTAVRAVIEAQIAVTAADRQDLLPELHALRRLYKNAPGQPEVLNEVRNAALMLLDRLQVQPEPIKERKAASKRSSPP